MLSTELEKMGFEGFRSAVLQNKAAELLLVTCDPGQTFRKL